ncbi:MAG: hypothetical protein QOF50_1169, partial [Gaiellaceae bacterium]|nr:hypothetical protein [Gaiellaceae bacterium]
MLVALPYQVYLLTGSTLLVGMLAFVELVPLLTLTLVGGALADAVDRRRLLIWTQLGMAVVGVGLVVNAAVSPTSLIVIPASAGPATDVKLPETLSSTIAAGTLSSGRRRGVIERIPPTPRQKNEAAKKPSTKQAVTEGWLTAAFTT